MMAERSLTLTHIALECGFSCSNHFSVAFRRVTWSGPTDLSQISVIRF
jgi:AraC-like DNA-binding protein